MEKGCYCQSALLLVLQSAAGVGCSAVQELVKVLPGVEEAARHVQVLQVLLLSCRCCCPGAVLHV
jgi:hypothetical protein